MKKLGLILLVLVCMVLGVTGCKKAVAPVTVVTPPAVTVEVTTPVAK